MLGRRGAALLDSWEGGAALLKLFNFKSGLLRGRNSNEICNTV